MIHHGDTEARSKLLYEDLTEKVIGAAIEVHRALGLNFNVPTLVKGGIVRKVL